MLSRKRHLSCTPKLRTANRQHAGLDKCLYQHLFLSFSVILAILIFFFYSEYISCYSFYEFFATLNCGHREFSQESKHFVCEEFCSSSREMELSHFSSRYSFSSSLSFSLYSSLPVLFSLSSLNSPHHYCAHPSYVIFIFPFLLMIIIFLLSFVFTHISITVIFVSFC